MFTNTPIHRFIFVLSFLLVFAIIHFIIFYPVYTSDTIMFEFALHPFNICKQYPNGWILIKKLYILFFLFSHFIVANFIYSFLFTKAPKEKNKNIISIQNNTDLQLTVGLDNNHQPVFLPLKGLFQNILITGTIGSGKTSSAMYPFTNQLIEFCASNPNKKLGMLILDVKGNYHHQVFEYCKQSHRLDDLIVMGLHNNVKYNPLDKPNLKASILANRLKTILTLFSPNNGESFWLDKVEQILTECIKLCRLYNHGYVTFSEIHKLITIPNYYSEKLSILRSNFIAGNFSKDDCYNLLSAIDFFEKEFSKLDDRTLSILKSEITRITGAFISDIDVLNTFSPKQKDITFEGFKDIIENGKIVVLNMNIAEYRNLSKIIAAYLKLDFQTEIMMNLANNHITRNFAFICDEYHEYVTSTDADFFAQSREAHCINIVSTQSYTSLLNTINNKYTVNAIVQNLVNKIWFRTDDTFTIEEAQKQIGKEEKIKYSKSISESAKETTFNYFTKKFNSLDSNISESINSYSQLDFVYDTKYFTQILECFHAISFLSTGTKIIPPQELNMIPYFK